MTTNHYSSAPVEDVSSPSIRCYEDRSRTPAKTMNIAAGSTVTFKSSNTMGHPGPVLFYMAKAPAGVSSWDGSGQVWFKVYESGATTDNSGVHFKTGMDRISVKIPASLPQGEYLLRAEHIALHKPGSSQHYVACGQVKVSGGGSGRPGPLVAFPGAYKRSDPGLNYNMYGSPVKPYPLPGPALWRG